MVQIPLDSHVGAIWELGLTNWNTIQIHGRLRGGGYGGASEGRGRAGGYVLVPIPVEWVCGACNANRCWSTRNSCNRGEYSKGVMVSDVSWRHPLLPFTFSPPPPPPPSQFPSPTEVPPSMLDPLAECLIGLLRLTPLHV